jgi:hypothetical protein
MAGGGVAALVALVGGLVFLTRDDGGSSNPVTASLTGTVVSESGEALPVGGGLEAYRITYRIESLDADDALATRTQVVTVERPFDAHVLRYSGAEAVGAPEVAVISNLGLFADVTSADAVQSSASLPSAALGDLRLDGVLDELVGAELFVPRERREVGGRVCQVYRTGQALESLQLSKPTDTDYADACIDADGLVLEEIAVVGGETSFYEIAVSVDTAPEVAADEFTVDGEPIGLADGGSELVELPSDVAPTAGYWVLPAPGGYEHAGRYAIRTLAPADAATTTTVGAGPPATVETYVDVYRDGPSFVIVHQGVASQSPGRDTTVGADVDAGALGSARVAYALSGNTLVVTTDTWFVEVTAPMSSADLGAIASSMTAAV